MKDRATYTIAGNVANFVLDLETGERRPGTCRDVVEFARLADALPNIDAVANQVVPQDVPGESAMVHAFHAIASNTTKPLVVWVPDGATACAVLDMHEAIVGAEAAKRPMLLLCNTIVSPLVWDENCAAVVIETAKRGIPQGPTSCPVAGMTGPMDLSGYLVLTMAEALSGVILAQAVRPGTPVCVTVGMLTGDMREGTPLFGATETMLLRAAAGQLLEFWDLPGLTAAFDSDAQTTDQQTGWEKLGTAMATLDTRLHLLVDAGMFATGITVAYEQLVIDDELSGVCKRLLRGIDVTPLSTAVARIGRVGPGGNYLGEKDTLRSLRQEHFLTRLASHATYQKWSEAGHKEIVQTARERARALLAAHQPAPLPAGTLERLDRLLAAFERRN